MELRAEDLAGYVRLVSPGEADTLARLRSEVERGERDLRDTRVAGGAGALRAALRLAPVGPSTVVLVGPFGDDEAAAGLLPEALDRARELGARLVRHRPQAERLGPRFREALLAHGFKELGERIEFKAPVEELPADGGTPLSWRTLDEVGRDEAARVLARVAAGDPRGDDEVGDPHAAIAGFLGTFGLTHGGECVQVGYLGGEAVAFVCAQVQPSDGWSRIAYMGVVPEARGKGLGTWVHRHGFRMIREQGGKLYHGGTAAANAAMVRLFFAHACRESARMLEFVRFS